ncbi:MAG: hypothetical protein Q9216_003353 [Gyalolechia sp. 2 TL-2023]
MVKRKLEADRPLHDEGREAKKPKQSKVPTIINGAPAGPKQNSTTLGKKESIRSEFEQDRKAREHARKLAKRQRRQEKIQAEATRLEKAHVDYHHVKAQQDFTIHEVDGGIERLRNEELQDQPTKDQARHEQTRDSEHKHDSVQKRDNQMAWRVSEAVGGQMLDIDPLFSPNEDYILLAHNASVNVYSTATSLLVRKLRLSHSERLSTFAISSAEPNHLYLATRTGIIQLWDWLEGRLLHFWLFQSQVYSLATSTLADKDQDIEQLVYTVDRYGAGPWRISAHRLHLEAEITEGVTLRKSKESITAFKVIDHGRVIIATSGSILTIGVAEVSEELSLKNLSYTWRDIECSEWISCFDVRMVKAENNTSGKNPQLPRTDVVIGGLKGSLHVYDDLLRHLVRKEKRSSKAYVDDWTPRKLHWHRSTVLSVKWSRDGNYIVSGGLETVLLIWQLETGSHTTLPHLGAPLDGIVISPSGSSYAVRLADNSAMILSTAELKPTFSVAGIQLPAAASIDRQLPHLSSVNAPIRKFVPSWQLRFPVTSGPLGVLCAVPATTSSRLPSMLPPRASYLHTFDITSAHQISKQALTRNKTTDLNIGPESNTIEEPNVILMQVSYDGQWLATVDEWMPPKSDLTLVTHDKEQVTKELRVRKEIYMKFWLWNNETKLWELVSRIDDLHAHDTALADRDYGVLDLVSNPTSNSFATIGSDGFVRIWTTSARERHGLTIKNNQGRNLMGWHCRSVISIDPETSSPLIYTGAKLAYSTDGSCLAVACSSYSPWTVHLIDVQRSTARTGPYGPLEGPLYGLGIIDRYLIMLSEQLLIWNLVTQRLAYGYTLSPQHSQRSFPNQLSHLAVDRLGSTFAVALPTSADAKVTKNAKLCSEITVFEPASPRPIFVQKLPQLATALTTMYNRPGYFVVDSTAEIRTLTPRLFRLDPSTTLPSPPSTPSRGLSNIYGNPRKVDDSGGEKISKQFATHLSTLSIKPQIDDHEPNVVPHERLAEIFDVGPGYAMPPVADLFERVAYLYAGKRET